MQYDSGGGAAAASSASEQQEATHPLILSLLAGLSTCLGASVVFFSGKGSGSAGEGGVGGGAATASSPKTTGSTSRKNSILGKSSSRDLLEDEDHQHLQQPPAPVAPRRRTTATAAPLGHGHMSFSLALAGSVMVTVSFYSLLPESFSADSVGVDEGGQGHGSSEMLSIRSVVFWERAAAFAAGCCLYWLLSKCAFPEPDTILGFDDGQGEGGNGEGTAESGVPLISGNGGSGGGDQKGASSAGDDADIELAPAASSSSLEEQHPVSATRILTPEKSSPGSNRRAFRARSHLSSSMDGNSTDGNINYNNNGNGDTGDALDASARSDAPESTERLVPYASGKDKGRRNFSSSIYFSFWECCCCCSSSCCGAMASCRRRGFSFSGSDLATTEARRAWRVTMLLFVSLAVHNFPEGFAVAASSIHSPKLGLTTTVAIALHNIPEGIAIAVPCLAARPDSPWLAFGLASLSGLAEPLGAAVALLVLGQVAPQGNGAGNGDGPPPSVSTKGVLSFVAGVMVMVAANELFPEAARHAGDGRLPMIAGTLAGAVIMIASDSYLES